MNRVIDKNYKIISLDKKISFDKTQHYSMLKVLEGFEIQWIYLNERKTIHRKPTSNILLDEEKSQSISIKLRNKNRVATSPTHVQCDT